MVPQLIRLWIVLCVVAGSVYPVVSGFEDKGNDSDGVTESNNSSRSSLSEKETGITASFNGTDSTESATSKNFTSTEAIYTEPYNNSLHRTVSDSYISVVSGNETEMSQFPSNASTKMTTELSPKKRDSTTTTTSTYSTTLETDKTWTDTGLSTSAASGATEEPDECTPDDCTSPSNCTFTKHSGCIRLKEDATEESFSYKIMVPNEKSLIFVEMEPGKENPLPESNIAFEFKECETTQTKWKIEAGKKMERQIYISRGSSLTLHIFTDKSWINSTLHYKELAFEANEVRVKDTVDEGVLVPPTLAGVRYRPITQITYLLTASKSRWNESSVMMTLSFVDLDEGDYLLIGAGKTTFAGPEPFHFTGRITKSRNYYIASDDVYVRFVSGASPKVNKKGFHIKWKRSGTAITKPDEEPEEETIPDYIIQSVGICFYNKSLIAEFNKSEDHEGPLQRFREKLASVANSYAKQKSIALDALLTASSVEIFRVSSIIEPIEDVMPGGGLYVMVSIVHHFERKTAVFRRRQLEEILDQLEKENEESEYSMLGFKAGRCPSVNTYLEWYIAAVLLVFISTIVLIIVWICSSVSKWKGFINNRRRSSQLGNVYCKEPEVPVRENDYIRYTPGVNKPQMKLTTCEGDTMTLEGESPNRSRAEHDDATDTVIYHQDWIMKKRPSSAEVPIRMTTTAEIETRRSFLQTFAAPVPSARNKSSDRMWSDIHMARLLPQETTQPVDHEYDALIFPSARSTSTTCLVNSEGETRL